MKKLKRLFWFVLIALSSFIIASCSDDCDSDSIASGESIYEPGASVDAVSFDDAYPIDLQIQCTGGLFVSAVDGQIVFPGEKKFAVHVEGDPSTIDRVFVSDGGVYQVEAIKQGDSDSYNCDFSISDERLYSSVLVQVIHKNKRASKEKFVFRTCKDNHISRFIFDGVGMPTAQDFFDGGLDKIASVFDRLMRLVFSGIESRDSGLISRLAIDGIHFGIAQDDINWIIDQVLGKYFEWNIYDVMKLLLGKDFTQFVPDESAGKETIMRLSVPPLLDLRSSQIRMEVDDVIIQHRIDGEPQWEASADLDLILDPKLEDSELAFYLRSVPEYCHFHIMRDNKGNLGLFDHSNLVNDIVEQLPVLLGGSEGGPIFVIDLVALDPFLILDLINNPLAVYAKEGGLFVDVAALDFDLSWLMDLFQSI